MVAQAAEGTKPRARTGVTTRPGTATQAKADVAMAKDVGVGMLRARGGGKTRNPTPPNQHLRGPAKSRRAGEGSTGVPSIRSPISPRMARLALARVRQDTEIAQRGRCVPVIVCVQEMAPIPPDEIRNRGEAQGGLHRRTPEQGKHVRGAVAVGLVHPEARLALPPDALSLEKLVCLGDRVRAHGRRQGGSAKGDTHGPPIL